MEAENRRLTRLSSSVQTRRAHSFTVMAGFSPAVGNSTSKPSHQHLRYKDNITITSTSRRNNQGDLRQVSSRTTATFVQLPSASCQFRPVCRRWDDVQCPSSATQALSRICSIETVPVLESPTHPHGQIHYNRARQRLAFNRSENYSNLMHSISIRCCSATLFSLFTLRCNAVKMLRFSMR